LPYIYPLILDVLFDTVTSAPLQAQLWLLRTPALNACFYLVFTLIIYSLVNILAKFLLI